MPRALGAAQATRRDGMSAVTSLTLDPDDFPLTGRPGRGWRRPGLRPPRWRLICSWWMRRSTRARSFVRALPWRASFPTAIASGIRGRDKRGGLSVAEKARSPSARTAATRAWPSGGGAAYEAVPALTCWYFSYWSGVPGGSGGLRRERRVIFVFPTNDGRFAVFVAWPRDQTPRAGRH